MVTGQCGCLYTHRVSSPAFACGGLSVPGWDPTGIAGRRLSGVLLAGLEPDASVMMILSECVSFPM